MFDYSDEEEKAINYILKNSKAIKTKEQAEKLWNYIFAENKYFYFHIKEIDKMIDLIDDIFA